VYDRGKSLAAGNDWLLQLESCHSGSSRPLFAEANDIADDLCETFCR
jgi:hypothetical protein